ncbi:MAG: ribosome assembly RNA-binding protein YhbY [Clostridia bacterium]|nr:ribosome assembly RNA-binding protein YhbY [Clostridia bacterium]
MTPKERAELRGKAQKLEAIVQVGKDGVTPAVVNTVDQALFARELIKITVLESCENSTKEVAEILSGRCRADVVQVIGRKIVLYKKNTTKRKKKEI